MLTIRRKGRSLVLEGLGGVDTKRVGVLDGQESWLLTGIRVGTYYANVSVQCLSFDGPDRGSYGGSSRDEAKCWYLLAPGEKLIVTKRGVIVR